MKIYAVLLILALASGPTFALDRNDQGLFALVDLEGTVTTKIAKLSLSDGQWYIEDRQPDGSWQDVNCGESCRLTISKPSDIQQFTKDLDSSLKDLSCVHNIAFAFCNDPAGSYHMLAFSEGRVIPLKWIRLDPETLSPASAP